MASSFINQDIRKEKGMTIYSIQKENQAVTSKEVVTVFDLGYRGIEKDYIIYKY